MKKVLGLAVVLLALFVMSGCQKSNSLKEINLDELFTMEGNYFVYFYRDDCPDCEAVKPVVINYNNLVTENKEHEGKRIVYAINLSKPENASVYRAYQSAVLNWGEGQGKEGDFWVNGVETIEDLYIGATSALISIGTTSDNRRVANYQAEGYDDIYERLINHLG